MQARTSEIQRLAKALESAGIKLDSVVSDLTGKSATLMIEGLIDGERRGQVLADLAIGRMRTAGKLADLSAALTGRFTDHHAALCRLHATGSRCSTRRSTTWRPGSPLRPPPTSGSWTC